MHKGRIFNIQRCSIHDGRGLRTLVFFKGCSLRCQWCANPESQAPFPEIMVNRNKCVGCGFCISACPQHAIKWDTVTAGLLYDREVCIGCGKCTELCCGDSRRLFGEEVSTAELYHRICRDRTFFDNSGGGVTFSGGEPLLQGAFLTDIARRCKENGIHVAIETCGYANYEQFSTALPYIDFIYYDIKHINSEKHRALTGQGIERIIWNLRKIATEKTEVYVRTPIIPGYNDDNQTICKIAQLCAELPGVKKYELLAYHRLGVSKYKGLDRPYLMAHVVEPAEIAMDKLVRAANQVLEKQGKVCFYNKDNNLE